MELNITTNPTPETYTVIVAGEIDISNADKLRDAIDLALEQPTEKVELDFAQVSYIDSTGIGVLVGAGVSVGMGVGSRDGSKSAACVCLPAAPSTERPWSRWKAVTASIVPP